MKRDEFCNAVLKIYILINKLITNIIIAPIKNNWEIPIAFEFVANVDPIIAPICAIDIIRPYAPLACSKSIIEFVNDQNNATLNYKIINRIFEKRRY